MFSPVQWSSNNSILEFHVTPSPSSLPPAALPQSGCFGIKRPALLLLRSVQEQKPITKRPLVCGSTFRPASPPESPPLSHSFVYILHSPPLNSLKQSTSKQALYFLWTFAPLPPSASLATCPRRIPGLHLHSFLSGQSVQLGHQVLTRSGRTGQTFTNRQIIIWETHKSTKAI